MLACKEGKSESCLSPEKVAAIKKAVGGPKTQGGVQVYPGFLYDTGITASAPIRGILSPGPGIFGPATTAMEVDVEKEALADVQPLVDSMSTNLTTFSGHGGKLIFYHGDSDPWFSPLDTFGYYKDMAAANGGLEAVSKWSQFYFVPGMGHCGGGPGLDQFDLLGATVNWVEKGTRSHGSNRDRQGIPGSQPSFMPLPQTRPIQRTRQYRGREQFRMPLNRLPKFSLTVPPKER